MNVFYGIFAAVGIAVFAVPPALIQRHIEHETIYVESKERLTKVSGSGGDTNTNFVNFVYTDDEAYVVKDSLWNWHFRARTVFASIPEGGTCDVTLSGYRWGFFSMHQNIIAASCR